MMVCYENGFYRAYKTIKILKYQLFFFLFEDIFVIDIKFSFTKLKFFIITSYNYLHSLYIPLIIHIKNC